MDRSTTPLEMLSASISNLLVNSYIGSVKTLTELILYTIISWPMAALQESTLISSPNKFFEYKSRFQRSETNVNLNLVWPS